MRRLFLALTVGLMVTGCGRHLAIQAASPPSAAPALCRCRTTDDTGCTCGANCACAKADAGCHCLATDQTTKSQAVFLEASSPLKLVGPNADGQALPEGIPHLAGLRIRLTPDGEVALLTAEGQTLAARTHLASDKVMFGIDLADGASISGVLQVRQPLPLVAVLVITDARGRIFAGRQEFAQAGARPAPKPENGAPEEERRPRLPTDVTGMLAVADAFSGTAE